MTIVEVLSRTPRLERNVAGMNAIAALVDCMLGITLVLTQSMACAVQSKRLVVMIMLLAQQMLGTINLVKRAALMFVARHVRNMLLIIMTVPALTTCAFESRRLAATKVMDVREQLEILLWRKSVVSSHA
jgi:hypothetical protein